MQKSLITDRMKADSPTSTNFLSVAREITEGEAQRDFISESELLGRVDRVKRTMEFN